MEYEDHNYYVWHEFFSLIAYHLMSWDSLKELVYQTILKMLIGRKGMAWSSFGYTTHWLNPWFEAHSKPVANLDTYGCISITNLETTKCSHHSAGSRFMHHWNRRYICSWNCQALKSISDLLANLDAPVSDHTLVMYDVPS